MFQKILSVNLLPNNKACSVFYPGWGYDMSNHTCAIVVQLINTTEQNTIN